MTVKEQIKKKFADIWRRTTKKLDGFLKKLNNNYKYRIKLLKFLHINAKYRCFVDAIVVAFAVVIQVVISVRPPDFLSNAFFQHIRDTSLMISMASTIGLSTVVVFGFNLGKSVQQSWRGTIRKHGLENLIGAVVPETNINYWQLILLVILYICIATDWCAFFYILLVYDVILYLLLLLEWWSLETAGYACIKDYYRKMSANKKKDFLSKILQGSVENSGQVNMRALKTYFDLLYLYLEEDIEENTFSEHTGNGEKRRIDTISLEEFYDRAKGPFYDTMRNLVLERKEQAYLVLSLIREFCDMKKKEIEKVQTQIMFSIMIEYALDKGEYLDIDVIYKGLANWSDQSISLRYCISIARLEFLYIANHNVNRIYWSNSVFSLYYPVKIDSAYLDVIPTLWYLWCCKENVSFLLLAKNLDNLLKIFENDTENFHESDTKDSFFMLIKGLRY